MCVHPLKGFVIGKTDNGKDKYKITSYKVDHVELRNGIWTCADSFFASSGAEKVVREFTEVPCGKCIDCRLQYSREWADRCMLEMKYHDPDECWFLTLTYDDEHIRDYGHDIFPGMLYKPDFQDFMKRLRDHIYRDYVRKIRFFACGEYGTQTFRPHYHAIIYGMPLKDMKLLSYSKKGFPLYTSEYLNDIWKNGYVVVGKVSWDTCAYTARYVLKKASGIKPDDYIDQGLTPEFVLMSRKPGIGALYFDENYKKIYENDEIFFSGDAGGRKAKPPKYFDKRLEVIDEGWYKSIKSKRKDTAIATRILKLARTDLDYEQLLEVEEKIIKNRIKGLPRNEM